MEEKIYTQEDMNNITSKVKESQKAKYEKTHVSLETYKELENKYNQLVENNKIDKFKEIFKQHNGNIDTYNDFIELNKDLLDMNDKDLSNRFEELQASKPHFFNKAIPSGKQAPNDSEVISELLENAEPQVVSGTIYGKFR